MSVNSTLLLLPLLASISLVYNATRYEHPERILWRSARWAGLVLAFFAVMFLLLYLSS